MHYFHYGTIHRTCYRTDSIPCFVVTCLASAVATISTILLDDSDKKQAPTATSATCSLDMDPPKNVSAQLHEKVRKGKGRIYLSATLELI